MNVIIEHWRLGQDPIDSHRRCFGVWHLHFEDWLDRDLFDLMPYFITSGEVFEKLAFVEGVILQIVPCTHLRRINNALDRLKRVLRRLRGQNILLECCRVEDHIEIRVVNPRGHTNDYHSINYWMPKTVRKTSGKRLRRPKTPIRDRIGEHKGWFQITKFCGIDYNKFHSFSVWHVLCVCGQTFIKSALQLRRGSGCSRCSIGRRIRIGQYVLPAKILGQIFQTNAGMVRYHAKRRLPQGLTKIESDAKATKKCEKKIKLYLQNIRYKWDKTHPYYNDP